MPISQDDMDAILRGETPGARPARARPRPAPPVPQAPPANRRVQAAPARQPARVGWAEEVFGRVAVGAVRDALQGTMDTLQDVTPGIMRYNERIWRGVGIPTDRIGQGIQDYNRAALDTYERVSGKPARPFTFRNGALVRVDRAAAERDLNDVVNLRTETHRMPSLPTVAEPVSGVGQVSREIGEFGVSFLTFRKQLGALQGVGSVARWARPVIAGAAAAFTDVEPMEGNLLNVADHFGLRSQVVDALAVDEDDDVLTARFKNAAVDGIAGQAVEALVGMVKGVRALNGMKSSLDVAMTPTRAFDVAGDAGLDASIRASIDSARPVATGAARAADRTLAAANEGASAADDVAYAPEPSLGRHPGDQGDLFGQTLTADDIATSVDGVADLEGFIRGLPEDKLAQLATDITSGHPADAMRRVGLNPASIDFARLLDEQGVEAVERLINHVANAYDAIAQGAGSAPRGWRSAAQAANALGGTEAQLVTALGVKTKGLDSVVMATKAVLGGSAARLTRMGEIIRDAAKLDPKLLADPSNPEFAALMRELDAHGVLQAHLKGSLSELGRGLAAAKASLTPRNALNRSRRLDGMIKEADGLQLDDVADADRLADMLRNSSPSERLRLIKALVDAGGDPEQMGKVLAENAGFRRFKAGIKEVAVGALFSAGTMTAQVIGGFAQVAGRTIARWPVHAISFIQPRRMADGTLSTAAQLPEFVAARMADQAYAAALLPALFRGMAAAGRMVVHEGILGAGELVGSVVGRDLGAEKLSAAAAKYIGARKVASKYARDDVPREVAWRISKETVGAWMDSVEHGPAVFRAGIRGLIGFSAGAFNSVGTISRASRVMAIDTIDELVGTTVSTAHRAGVNVSAAVKEGMSLGHRGKALSTYVATRSKQLAEYNSEELMDKIDRLVAAGSHEGSDEVNALITQARTARSMEGEVVGEARHVLFQDDLEWKISQRAESLLGTLDQGTGLLFPFIRTPLRIIESSLSDYTLVGLANKNLYRDLLSGGVEAQVAVSRITLGTLSIAGAYQLASQGVLRGEDGGYNSSQRLGGAPSYSIKIGDTWFEVLRADPLGLMLGMGADMYELEQAAANEGAPPEGLEAAGAMAVRVFTAFARNALSKTWMRDFTDLTAAASAKNAEAFQRAMGRFLVDGPRNTLAPAGGWAKMMDGEDNEVLREAIGDWDKYIARTPWANTLPGKRDPLLGNVIDYERIGGIPSGSEAGMDVVVRALDGLNFELPNDRKLKGVDLTSVQVTRLRELTGHVTVSPNTGLTQAAALRELVTSPEWATMSEGEKVKEVRKYHKAFAKWAREALLAEDRALARKVALHGGTEAILESTDDSSERQTQLNQLEAVLDSQ